jgi:hypothetical protein
MFGKVGDIRDALFWSSIDRRVPLAHATSRGTTNVYPSSDSIFTNASSVFDMVYKVCVGGSRKIRRWRGMKDEVDTRCGTKYSPAYMDA